MRILKGNILKIRNEDDDIKQIIESCITTMIEHKSLIEEKEESAKY